MMKLLSQLEHVESATPFARRDDGNTSVNRLEDGFFRPGKENEVDLPEGMAQPTGPQLAPNAIIYTNSKATEAQPCGRCAGQLSEYRPTRTAMITWLIVINNAPERSRDRRPKLSIVQMVVITPTNCVTLRIPDIKSCMS